MIPVYNIILGDSCGIRKMSLVESPAVESDFIAFSKQEELKFSVDEEQHIVFGCALRADFPIYRFDSVRGEYFVVFTKENIKCLYEKFMKDGANSVNLNHAQDTDGVFLIQSFLKDTTEGISPVGYEDIADGSWFCAYKVENSDVWNKVKAGDFRGFSVEGYFEIIEETKDEIDTLLDKLLN